MSAGTTRSPESGAGESPAPGPDPGEETPGGTLYVVATPIGNLADITLRALEVLAAAPLIAAEDTRHVRRLLDRHGISGRVVSYHARSAPGRTRQLLEHLRSGDDVALVTDAGTPAISDPGEQLVAAWAAEHGRVVPVPGASAVLAAVAASGIAGPRWCFEGFLPRSGRERRERLARIAGDPRGTVIFEAPSRAAATLADLAVACGPDRPGAVCRELTKIHEEIRRAGLGELAGLARSGGIQSRGEFVILVGALVGSPADAGDHRADGARASPGDGAGPEAALAAARADVDALAASGVARGEAARRVAARTGLPRRRLYGAREER